MAPVTYSRNIQARNMRNNKKSLRHKISPIGVRISQDSFSILEIPESFPISENPEIHFRKQDIIEIHEVKKPGNNPEEILF